MLVRAIERVDGGVSIVYPCRPPREDESDEQYYADIWAVALEGSPELQDRPYADIDSDSDALPSDLTTRNRWRLADGRVVVGD